MVLANPLAYPDDAETGGLVQRQARDVLGENTGRAPNCSTTAGQPPSPEPDPGDEAKAATTKFATENGGEAIGMTVAGQALETSTANMDWAEAKPFRSA